MSKIPFFKFFTKTKFSVSDVNKDYVGVNPQPSLRCVGRIWKRSIKDSPCHLELVSGSYHRQKFSTICAQKSNVGLKAQPTKAISYASWKATRHVRGDLVPAFTLAEVLITLGIIGVVAAMTLPTLIANYQKKETISKIQKVYTVLNQAFKLSEVDNGEFEYWDVDHSDPDTYFEKYWKPYFKVAKTCNTYQECGYRSPTPFQMPNGIMSTFNVVSSGYRRTFITTDGFVLAMSVRRGGGTLEDGTLEPIIDDFRILVDINGANRPNQNGKDTFYMQVTKKGVLADGYEKSNDEIEEECSTIGEYCFSKLIRDGWKIKDDYPW